MRSSFILAKTQHASYLLFSVTLQEQRNLLQTVRTKPCTISWAICTSALALCSGSGKAAVLRCPWGLRRHHEDGRRALEVAVLLQRPQSRSVCGPHDPASSRRAALCKLDQADLVPFKVQGRPPSAVLPNWVLENLRVPSLRQRIRRPARNPGLGYCVHESPSLGAVPWAHAPRLTPSAAPSGLVPVGLLPPDLVCCH